MSENETNQWYTNKELFERLGDLRDDFSNLRIEMKETRTLIKSYNGLREQIEKIREENKEIIERIKEENDEIRQQVSSIVNKDVGKNATYENLRNWGGWIFGLISLLVLMYNQII